MQYPVTQSRLDLYEELLRGSPALLEILRSRVPGSPDITLEVRLRGVEAEVVGFFVVDHQSESVRVEACDA